MGAPLACSQSRVDVRVVARHLEQSDVLETGVAQQRGHGVGRAAHLGRGEALGRHARDAHQLRERILDVAEAAVYVAQHRGDLCASARHDLLTPQEPRPESNPTLRWRVESPANVTLGCGTRHSRISTSSTGTTLAGLAELVRIPSVSAAGFPPAEVRRSAEATAALLRKLGLENVRLLEVPGATPTSTASGCTRRAHPRCWSTRTTTCSRRGGPSVAEPALRADRARRAALRPARPTTRASCSHVRRCAPGSRPPARLPLNLKVLIEGEEEIGSPGLTAFLASTPRRLRRRRDGAHRHRQLRRRPPRAPTSCAASPRAVRSWTARPLRHVRRRDPRPGAHRRGCSRASSTPTAARDLRGRVPRWRGRARGRPGAACRGWTRASALGGDAARHALRGSGLRALERLWTRPSLTVIALEAHPIAGSPNQVIDSARARVSLRTVPRMDERKPGRCWCAA